MVIRPHLRRRRVLHAGLRLLRRGRGRGRRGRRSSTSRPAQPEPILVEDFEGIDGSSSPIRYRACFTAQMSFAALTETYAPYDDADAAHRARLVRLFRRASRSGRRWKRGEAFAFLGQKDIHDGVDRVVADLPRWPGLRLEPAQREIRGVSPWPICSSNSSPKKSRPGCRRRAGEDLKKLVTDGLVEAGLTYAAAAAFTTPRRLALTVEGLPAMSPDTREERKGPKVGAPDKAIEGFLRGAGVSPRPARRARHAQGRGLFRHHRKAGPPGRRDRGRGAGEDGAQLPLAEVDALGRGQPCAGCARCIPSSAS